MPLRLRVQTRQTSRWALDGAHSPSSVLDAIADSLQPCLAARAYASCRWPHGRGISAISNSTTSGRPASPVWIEGQEVFDGTQSKARLQPGSDSERVDFMGQARAGLRHRQEWSGHPLTAPQSQELPQRQESEQRHSRPRSERDALEVAHAGACGNSAQFTSTEGAHPGSRNRAGSSPRQRRRSRSISTTAGGRKDHMTQASAASPPSPPIKSPWSILLLSQGLAPSASAPAGRCRRSRSASSTSAACAISFLDRQRHHVPFQATGPDRLVFKAATSATSPDSSPCARGHLPINGADGRFDLYEAVESLVHRVRVDDQLIGLEDRRGDRRPHRDALDDRAKCRPVGHEERLVAAALGDIGDPPEGGFRDQEASEKSGATLSDWP